MIITLDIPEDRYAEFVLVAANFLAGPPTSETDGPERGPWTPDDGEIAAGVVRRMTPAARRLFGLLAIGEGDRPDGRWSTAGLTEMLHLNTGNELAGMLAWPGRFCYREGRMLPFRWENTDEGGSYWMEETEAQLFAAAVETVDPGLWAQLQER